jgi:L-amino acid N-acyltransferase YncA
MPSITAIYREAVRQGTASFEIEPPDDREMMRRMRFLVDGGFPFMAALQGGRVVGYAYAGPYRSRPAYRFTVEDSVYVGEEARGLGAGRALLTRLITEAEHRGFRQMIAVIGDSANRASITLHSQLGFRMVGTLEAVGWKLGSWLDSVVMQMSLGGGNSIPPDARSRADR